jgi:tetratricopeptide (TPR) repeat protein
LQDLGHRQDSSHPWRRDDRVRVRRRPPVVPGIIVVDTRVPRRPRPLFPLYLLSFGLLGSLQRHAQALQRVSVGGWHAEELRQKGDFAAALPLYEVVQRLDKHSGSVPQSMENEKLMAAAAKVSAGKANEAAEMFERAAVEAASSGNALAAELAKAGQAIAWLQMDRAQEALEAFPKIIGQFAKLSRIPVPADCQEQALYKPLDEERTPVQAVSAKPGEPPVEARYRSVLRDMYLLRAVAQMTVWRKAAGARDQQQTMATGALRALWCSLEFDPQFADALGLYGMILHFRGRKKESALSYLEAARRAGFEEPALVTLLQIHQNLSKTKARTKTELMDHLQEYFTNPEVPKLLKQQLLREEAIRTGYGQYVGVVAVDEIPDAEPSVPRLVNRTSRLAEDLTRILKEWESAGEQPQKIAVLKDAIEAVVKGQKQWVDGLNALEENEAKLLRAAGLCALSEEF